jgi:hypothetical protein
MSEPSTNISSEPLCNVLFDEFTSVFKDLTLGDLCPVCKKHGARHNRREENQVQHHQMSRLVVEIYYQVQV